MSLLCNKKNRSSPFLRYAPRTPYRHLLSPSASIARISRCLRRLDEAFSVLAAMRSPGDLIIVVMISSELVGSQLQWGGCFEGNFILRYISVVYRSSKYFLYLATHSSSLTRMHSFSEVNLFDQSLQPERRLGTQGFFLPIFWLRKPFWVF